MVKQADALKIKGKLNLAKNKAQKIRALDQEKKRIHAEAKGITSLVTQEVNNLLKAKGVGQKLNNLLQKYTLKLKKEALSQIGLVDRVEIKRELKAKLAQEVEGFRTSGTQYAYVSKVDPVDLKRIVNQVKKKLGY